MGLLDVFKKNKNIDQCSGGKTETVEKNLVSDVKEDDITLTEEQVEAIVKKVEKKTGRKSYRLKINLKRKPGLLDTKFGGVPYWESGREYPRDSKGKPLFFLAQLNMADFSESNLLPSEGLLQFFVGSDDVYGLDFDVPDSQSDFRVIYHDELDDSVTADEILALGALTTLNMEDAEECYFPLDGEYAVDVCKTMISMGTSDYRYEKYVHQAVEELGLRIPDKFGPLDVLPGEKFNKETEKNTGHWVLGYPYFTQNDPRDYSQKLEYYDTLLFQMDSEFQREKGYEIIWGDSGVAGFFVNHEDLKKRDFSKVLYNWDCF